MSFLRLYLVVEGETELKFANDTLKPHLANFSVGVSPMKVVTNRKLGQKGGVLSFAQVARDLQRLLQQDRRTDARFSTMLDLYALPSGFPGWREARKQRAPRARAEALENALATHFNDTRFLPYLQLHEFESLLFAELDELERRIPHHASGFAQLRKDVSGLSPEEINDDPNTAPSKRIVRFVPSYEGQKTRVGAPAASAIGLAKLRAMCPHFNSWITRLEGLAQ